MAYVEWHGNLPQHHKTAWLMTLLKIGKAQAVGTRGCLYAWAIENRPGGIIERSLLWFACAWEGDKAALEKALIDSKLVDAIDKHTVKLHDWDDYTRGYRKARADAERRLEERRADVARQSRAGSAAAAHSPPRSDLNGADLSGTEQNGEEKRPDPPAGGPKDGTAWGLCRYFKHCKMPTNPTKKAAFEELMRQGVTYEAIKASGLDDVRKGWDFFDHIRALKPPPKVASQSSKPILKTPF